MGCDPTNCEHANGRWVLQHYWACKLCGRPIPPKSNTYQQKVAVDYAPHWDVLRKTWDEFRKTELGLLH